MKPNASHRQSARRAWLAELPSSAGADGLTSQAAALALVRFGPNVIANHRERNLLWQFLSRFRNPLVILLLAASGVSAFTGELTNCLIISSIVLMSVTLDFVQEHRANEAAARLRQSVAVTATLQRDGATVSVPVSGVVPGDIAILAAGDMVPGDGVVLDACDLFVKQALLTGEPYPVEKRPGTVGDRDDLPLDATDLVFMGTTVVSGSARVRVLRTGTETAIGGIADQLNRPPPPTAFELGTQRFGLLILRLTLLLVLFVLLANALLQKPWLESFLFAVALAVGLTPELLPMVVSITLSQGALNMAQRRVVVKRLAAIQNLGSMNVLCTDKTGTLTEAKIRLEQHIDPQGAASERVLELAFLNSYFETGLRSPLDEAILAHEHIDSSGWTKVDEVPFDFERRRVSVLLANDTERLLIVKGAPDEILALCTAFEAGNAETVADLDAPAAERVRAQQRTLETQGFRVLGIAWRRVPPAQDHAVVDDESQLVFAGFAGFLDPPKASAGQALAALARSGVAVKIVTGDSELVTQHVCGELGIPVTGILTGTEIAHLDEQGLSARIDGVNLFCRVNPVQKDRVVRALKARGNVVGYLGDGINDAPPLHSADVGLSVDSAVDVAKEAADMILLDHDLNVLLDGVLEGRRTFGNIMKYIMMGTSSNFGNMFSMAGASVLLPFLPMLPTQILLNNILYDLSEIPIPLDHLDPEELQRPRILDIAFIRNFMLIVGPISSAFDFLTFYLLLSVLHADASLFQTGWFIESLATQVLVIFVIRTRGNPLRSSPHPWLLGTSLGVVALAAILPLTPAGAYFGFSPLPGAFYAMLAGLVIAYLIIVETAKRAFYRWHGL